MLESIKFPSLLNGEQVRSLLIFMYPYIPVRQQVSLLDVGGEIIYTGKMTDKLESYFNKRFTRVISVTAPNNQFTFNLISFTDLFKFAQQQQGYTQLSERTFNKIKEFESDKYLSNNLLDIFKVYWVTGQLKFPDSEDMFTLLNSLDEHSRDFLALKTDNPQITEFYLVKRLSDVYQFNADTVESKSARFLYKQKNSFGHKIKPAINDWLKTREGLGPELSILKLLMDIKGI